MAEGLAVHDLPPGTKQGLNDWQHIGYGGPCPPFRRHRYVHKLFALDVPLPALKQRAKQLLQRAMQGHVPTQAGLDSYYQRRH